MLPGISSYTYGWNVGIEGAMPENPMNELDLVAQTLAFGMKCLQLGDNLPVHTFDPSRQQVLKDLINKNEIRLELGARKLTPEHLQEYMDLCHFFGSPLLRFVIDGEDYEPDLKEVAHIIIHALPTLSRHNITLGIENHDRFKAKELAELMDNIGSNNVGICLDCVNSVGAGEGLTYVADILAPYTVNLHVKDFITRRLPHKMGFITEGAIAGKGMTDLPWLLEKIGKYGRCQSAILEQWVPPAATIEDTCRKEKEWAEIGAAYLKSLVPTI
ncbi:sugar phosphate isomerase/epimerase family protein [Dyadobacter luticola]|uniref:Sugar phosphate isomerase/epimerase n=1 Tax=Dyadobacter luticola TaxID=1979387 RepID=A0A5R9L3S2_9BACT|nr:TIM barrel protein [Dyadobacter luticola]TLV03216.1 sugar phosphate isomerase/epimerase [Dyadobacter luticola]